MSNFKRTTGDMDDRISGLLEKMTLEEKCSQLIFNSPAIPRLDIDEYNWWNECLHGVARAGKATVFPQAIALAATFNLDLIEEIAGAISDEARVKHNQAKRSGNRDIYRGLTFWTPNINIFRDPRWGRGHETYGEDPWLTSAVGVRFVQGLQGDDHSQLKTAACAKHFAVHSGPEKLRHAFNAEASPQDMAETYLPAFKALVDAGVEAVMGAYNSTNGEPCCASKPLLVDTLRGNWQFEGHVVSDCWAIRDIHEYHGKAEDPVEATALALNMGCDLNCGCTYRSGSLIEAIERGLLSEETVDKSLTRLYATRMKLGMFDPPGTNRWDSLPDTLLRCDEHRALAEEAAAESIVLLKNDGVLPISRSCKSILVTGPNAAETKILMGNYHGISPRLTTILEGMAEAADEGQTIGYVTGCLLDVEQTTEMDWVSLEAEQADVIVAVCGLSPLLESEEGDSIRSEDEGDRINIGLPENQKRFLKRLSECGRPVILVLSGGSAIAVPDEFEWASAVLYCWYPGEAGGTAVSDILFGNRNPSGRLPITVPKSLEQLPSYTDYNMKNRTYRYMKEAPLFPFGFGLSYSRFSYSGEKIEKSLTGWTVKAKVSNTGKSEGMEVAQLYVIPPQAEERRLPRMALKGIKKIHLGVGESKDISFEVNDEVLKFADKNGEFKYWDGEYLLSIGGCSPDSRNKELGAELPKILKIKRR